MICFSYARELWVEVTTASSGGGESMREDGVWGVLDDETQQRLAVLTRSPGLSGSHMKVLLVLREVCTSPKHISELSGLGVPRVRERLRQLEQRGYVTILETLSDRTNVWALVDNLRPKDLPSHPTEPYIASRRQQQVDGLVTRGDEYSWLFDKKPTLTLEDLKKYEAK